MNTDFIVNMMFTPLLIGSGSTLPLLSLTASPTVICLCGTDSGLNPEGL